MNSSLTQKDIDALVHGGATASGLGRSADVVPVNFLIPARVSRERRTVLESIYGRYALALQAFLSSRLRTPIDVTVHSIEQATFGEFLMSLATPCSAFTFKLGDGGNHGVVDLGSGVAFHLVDRLFGGAGEAEPPRRPLTTLEQAVVRGVCDRAIALLRSAWAEHLALAPEVVGFESNPEMVQVVNREDHVLVATLEMRSGAFTGYIALCLPMAGLERFLQDDADVRTGSASGMSREVIEHHVRHAHVDMNVRIPAFRLSMRAISELVEGQTLLTGQPAEAPVDVLVNGKLRYRGSLGQVRRHLALKVEQFITPPAVERPAREGRVL